MVVKSQVWQYIEIANNIRFIVKKSKLDSFLENLLNRTGRWYPILILLFMQTINTPLIILLTAMPAQQNAEFSKIQGTSLLVFGIVVLLIRNTLLLLQVFPFNKDMIVRLSELSQSGMIKTNPKQERRAWEQASSFTKRYIYYEFMAGIALVLVPTTAYAYFGLHLSNSQIIYLVLAAVPASLVNLILENLTMDQWFKPVIQALIPKRFNTQLAGIKGMRLWVKLAFTVMSLAMIGILLIIPAAYHQVMHIALDISGSQKSLSNALLVIVNAGVGAVITGLFITFQIVPYFTNPFLHMIKLFKKVEAGDLSQRIEVSLPDEFGELNLYINHMISRLQKMTSTLEQRVAERTARLNQVNKQLQIELKERKRIQDQLAFSALHDPLTELPNRNLFMDRLHHVMERAKRNKKYTYAVLFMDLDRFKVANDSLGHNVGDLLLVESAHRLAACVRSEDTVARLGGDEFVILLEEVQDPMDYKRVADRIQSELAMPYNLNDHKVFITTSIGIVKGTDRYEQTEDLIRDADIAMYQAKRQGRGRYEIFNPMMLEGAKLRLSLETDLRKALEKHEFVLHYQPILDLKTNRIIAFEALVRWQHPTRGLIPPAEFIPIAEENGLIVPIGYWILDEACRQIHDWQIQYPVEPPLKINVNLSTRQCMEKDLVKKIVEILKKNKLDASYLNLELTESLIVEDTKSITTMLLKMRELGIRVQIDDFGTGYSSLGYLHTLPIDVLKIDRTFINQLGIRNGSSEIVQTILSLAHGLGMKVVAEGVETKSQLSKLKVMGCEYVQGFLFAEPINSQGAGNLLKKSFSKDVN